RYCYHHDDDDGCVSPGMRAVRWRRCFRRLGIFGGNLTVRLLELLVHRIRHSLYIPFHNENRFRNDRYPERIVKRFITSSTPSAISSTPLATSTVCRCRRKRA